jgi:WD40 repeat protein
VAESSDLEGPAPPALQFSPDSTILAWPEESGIRLWNVRKQRWLGTIPRTASLSELSRVTGALAFVEGGRAIAVASDHGVEIWDVRRLRRVRILGGSDAGEIASDLGGTRLVELGEGFALVRDAAAGRVLARVRVDSFDRHPALSPDGRTLAYFDLDSGAVRLWPADSLAGRAERLRARVASNVVSDPHGRLVALAADGTIIRDVERAPTPDGAPLEYQTLGQILVGGDGRVLSSRYLRTLVRPGQVELRSLAGIALARSIRHSGAALAFDDHGRALALLAEAGPALAIWDVTRGVPITRLQNPTSDQLALGGTTAVVYDNSKLSSWKVDSGSRIDESPYVVYHGADPVISPDGSLLALPDVFGTTIWSLPKLRLRASLPAVSGPRAFSPDSSLLAIGGARGSLRLFDASTGRALGDELPGFSRPLASVSFASDGRILGVDENGRVTVWDLLFSERRLDPWLARLCQATAENLSPAEWSRYFGNEPRRATCRGRG